MARREVVEFVDDLDGSSGSVETVTFGIDGASYEIDLNERNSSALRDTISEYVSSARRVGGRARPAATPGRSAAAGDRAENAQIREWARGQGLQVSERGRIPSVIIEKYRNR